LRRKIVSDSFESHQSALDSPATRAASVTPSDSADLPNAARSLYVGNGGDIRVLTTGGDEVLFGGVPDGAILPVRVRKVFDTQTGASAIIALW
jgi:hypothetical protein